jgi:hypothetical protein
MDEIEPLTPPPPSKKTQLKDAYASYREAALSDGFMFGDYNGYDAYKE